MYTFNYLLLRSLYQILRITRKQLLATLNVAPTTFDYWFQSKDIPLAKLILLCNTYHISISEFIVPNTKGVIIKTKEDYVLSQWKDITTDMRLMGDTILSSNTVRGACKELNMGTGTFYQIFRSDTLPIGFMTGTWLDYINRSRLYPGDFILDYNRPIEVLENYSVRKDSQEEELKKANRNAHHAEMQNKILRAKIEKLQARIRELEGGISYPSVAAENHIT